MMKWIGCLLMALGLCLCGALPARAEQVVEAWRSPFGAVRSVSVNPTDGSCWMADGGQVLHVAADGTILAQLMDFMVPVSIAVNPTDGSCWVADAAAGFIVHLGEDGTELRRETVGGSPQVVATNPTDGSCWVAASQGYGSSPVIHLSAAGTELWRGTQFRIYSPESASGVALSVNPTDGSCWVADILNGQVVHLSDDGDELFRGGSLSWPFAVSVNPTDGSCWVIDNSQVVHLESDGEELWRGGGLYQPFAVSVNPVDGSCWVADSPNMYTGEAGQVVHLAENGAELWRGDSNNGWAPPVSVNPTDGSCWVGGQGQATHLAADGTQLWRGEGFAAPGQVAVNSADGSCWVTDGGLYIVRYDILLSDWLGDGVYHLAQDGALLWSQRDYDTANWNVSVNPTDGSCWVSGAGGDTSWGGDLRHLAEDGTELWQIAGGYEEISVNTTDGSCWVTDSGAYQAAWLAHFSSSGTELWRRSFLSPQSPSANSADGSCWLLEATADSGSRPVLVVHLAADGTELLRMNPGWPPISVAVDPTDGSAWVGRRVAIDRLGSVVHFAEDGAVLSEVQLSFDAVALAVNPADGSCWAASGGNVYHIRADGVPLWDDADIALAGGPYLSVNPTDGSCWVADASSSQVVRLAVIPEHGAVFSASSPRAKLLNEGPLEVAFYDLSLDNPTSWLWDFGDGATSTQQNPVHSYTTAGRFHVSLTVVTDLGSDTETKEDYITVEFGDVYSNYWAYDAVMGCVDASIVKGYDDGKYHPEYTVTRDQMAVYISRALAGGDSSIPNGPATPSFSDVPATHWAYKHIEYAVSQNVVKGYADGTYLPSVTVDRGTMAVYVARAMVAPGGDAAIPDPVPPATFPDVATTFWAYKQVEYCVGEGVVKGYDDGSYHPERQVTRDQMAVYIARAFGLL